MSSAGALLLAPGAGADRDHHTLCAVADAVAPLPTERMDFPARRAGRKGVDRAPVAIAAVVEEAEALVASARIRANRLVLGGRSFGGRMCSMAAADGLSVKGLVLISYPLHPPAKPEKLRTEHLPGITVPTLCISGTKDTFGSPAELRRHFRRVKGDVTWSLIEKKGHDLKGCDDFIAATVSEWLKSARPRG